MKKIIKNLQGKIYKEKFTRKNLQGKYKKDSVFFSLLAAC